MRRLRMLAALLITACCTAVTLGYSYKKTPNHTDIFLQPTALTKLPDGVYTLYETPIESTDHSILLCAAESTSLEYKHSIYAKYEQKYYPFDIIAPNELSFGYTTVLRIVEQASENLSVVIRSISNNGTRYYKFSAYTSDLIAGKYQFTFTEECHPDDIVDMYVCQLEAIVEKIEQSGRHLVNDGIYSKRNPELSGVYIDSLPTCDTVAFEASIFLTSYKVIFYPFSETIGNLNVYAKHRSTDSTEYYPMEMTVPDDMDINKLSLLPATGDAGSCQIYILCKETSDSEKTRYGEFYTDFGSDPSNWQSFSFAHEISVDEAIDMLDFSVDLCSSKIE